MTTLRKHKMQNPQRQQQTQTNIIYKGDAMNRVSTRKQNAKPPTTTTNPNQSYQLSDWMIQNNI